MSWIIQGLALSFVAAIGWWFFRYARSVNRGDYRHPKDRGQTWHIPGGGTHGNGNVPPLLPNPDPEDEIFR